MMFSNTRALSATIVAILLTGLAGSTTKAAESDKPNVIFILCDDLGWGDLGVFYQNDSSHERSHSTPQLDKMAAEGMQLRAHYCPAPVCAPSRASLLTGLHQGHATVRDNQFDKALADNHTLGTLMKTAGYRTALIGKYGLQGEGSDPSSWPAYPTKRGFDEFYGYVRHVDGHVHYPANRWPLGNSETHRSPKQVWHNEKEVSEGLDKCYTTDLFTARAKHWISEHREASPQQPFFLYLAYDTPHAALQVPSTSYPEGRGLSGGLQWLGEPGRMINTATGEIDSYRHPDYTGKDWSDVEVRFATMVRRIDNAVGDLLQTLRDLEIADNTLVVISSDNGPHHESYLDGKNYAPTSFQSYGIFDGTKRDTWEGGIRVPTLAWWPGKISAGSVTEEPSQFHDWMATVADLGGLPAPASCDGVSLVPTLTGEGDQVPSQIYVEYWQNGSTKPYDDFIERRRGTKRGQMQVIFLDGYKGVRTDIESHDDPFEIYDVKADPSERENLAGTSQEFDALQQRMKDRVLQIRIPNPSAQRPYDDQLVPADSTKPTRHGLQLTRYEGDFPFVPRVSPQTSDGSLVVASPTVDDPVASSSGAVQFRGWIEVTEPGDYEFLLSSDHGAVLEIHDATVVDADFGTEAGDTVTGGFRLARGYHPVRITARIGDDGSQSNLGIRWSRNGQDATEIPESAWWTN